MEVAIEQSPDIRSLTIQHLLGWIECLSDLLTSDENPFEDTDELATSLENWRHEFQSHSGQAAVIAEPVKVFIYGADVILICNELTGEWVKLTVTPLPVPTHGA